MTTEADGARLRIRRMRPSDLDAVMTIERESYPMPWPRRLVREELARPGGICLVAELAGARLGYILVALQFDVWHILNVTVHPLHRGRRIGEALLTAAMQLGDRLPHNGYTLEVRPSNAAAIRLYERMGFTRNGVRPRYYSDNGEDALIMWRTPETA